MANLVAFASTSTPTATCQLRDLDHLTLDMAVAHKKRKTRWDQDEERKLIEVWAEILVETNGKMVTRKKKEALATQQINLYVTKELGKTTTFNKKEIRNKIDGLMKKGKNFYSLYRKKRKQVKRSIQT